MSCLTFLAMPAAITSINWDDLKLRYLRNEASLAELAATFGVSLDCVRKRCQTQGWAKQKASIEQGNSKTLTVISNRIAEKSTQKAVDAISLHLSSVLTTGNGFLSKLQDKLEQALLPDITRLDHAESATRIYEKWDDLIRRAHGLSDPTNKVDITTGGLPMHEKALSILQSCQQLVKTGQASAVDIDVDGLTKELELAQSGDAGSNGNAATATIGDATATASPSPSMTTGTPSPSATDTLSL